MNSQPSAITSAMYWFGLGAHIALKLYGPLKIREFWRDRNMLVMSLARFRSRCKGRGWEIPEKTQTQLLNKLVNRCKEAIDKNAIQHDFIPGYLGKALNKFVDEIADDAQRRWKSQPNMAAIPAQAAEAAILAAMQIRIEEKLQNV